MLDKAIITTMVPVTDVDRAAHFYGHTLGLRERQGSTSGRVFETAHGSAIELLTSESGNRPTGHTVLRFLVDDIDREVAELSTHGVEFDDYDLPELTTVGHVADLGGERVAWFNDSEGNTLCVYEVVD
jgi:catechol 2,3-dioxygenase-like lactoylglutathione lyase family enzyme